VAWLNVGGCHAIHDAKVMELSEARGPVLRRTIVVVDGDIQARICAADQLRAAGFRVLEARDGGEASVLLMAYSDVDLVVTDLQSSGSSNGLAISQWLAREQPHIPVLHGAQNLVDRVAAVWNSGT